ncbi:phosphatidic acid phosphatase type 2/haloperoxidase [Mortierella sp. GBAus27b]|nr:phosphatidic acid phosphatase type 2/haloperoxidase [Mortierella sp. GBAus27b]
MDFSPKRLRTNPTVRLICSYLLDWILCCILLLLFFLLDNVEPFHREFSVENKAIMFPYKEQETIPIWALGLMAVAFPVLVILVVSLGIRRSLYDVHNGFLGLLVSVLLTTIFTQVLKITVGKHRPDFLSRCQPMLNGTAVIKDEPLHLWTHDLCTQTDSDILKDGYRSFPSGHASTSFAGLFYIALWLAGKMHVFDRRGYSLKGVILVVPVLTAMLIAISRVQDYRHAAFDVTWGSIIGIVFGTFAYHQYYPALTARKSHVPHPPRDFAYLVHDSQGQIHEPGHLEMVTGIQRNDSFVDESRVEPEQLQDLEAQDHRRPKTPQNLEGST